MDFSKPKPSSWLDEDINGVLLDISGVLKDGPRAIDGSISAFDRLKESKIKVCLVTNETQLARSFLHDKLTNIGYKIDIDDIIAPAPNMAIKLKKEGLRPELLVHPDVLPEFESVDVSNPKNCVVIGDAAEYFDYNSLNKTFGVLLNMKEPRFFTLGRGKYYRHNGELVLDVGPFTKALEYATGIKAELIGKPSQTFFQAALDHLGLNANEVIMVGDDIVGDVGGAQKSGIRGVLVRTGKFRPSDETHSEVTPDCIVDNLAHAVDLILNRMNSKANV